MDTSEEYIRMCKLATEIQQKWRPQNHDVIAIKYITEYETDVQISHHMAGSVFDVHDMRLCLGKDYHWVIWLPRQDQIQHMSTTEFNHTFKRFLDYVDNLNKKGYFYKMVDSWEKLWLGFMMYYCSHWYVEEGIGHKAWNGVDWVFP